LVSTEAQSGVGSDPPVEISRLHPVKVGFTMFRCQAALWRQIVEPYRALAILTIL
jgi:hypothetical protein